MIIDADCHISSRKFDSLALTAQELVAILDREEVQRALVWLRPPYDKAIDAENAAVYQAMKTYPERLLGFGWVNPMLGKTHALATIRRCFEEYGCYGIKFNGAQDGYVIDDAAVLPLIEAAAAYGKPIAFHIGADFYENTHPYRLGAIAARFPQTQFLMVHMGGAGLPDLSRAAIETAQQHANITLIGSTVGDRAVLQALQALGSKRVCYGSDAPFHLVHVCLAMYQALLRDFSAAERADVMGGNIARILGLPV